MGFFERFPAMNGAKVRMLSGALLALLCIGLAVAWLRPQSAPPIRIGVIHSLTGTMAISEKPLVDAVRLAVEEINAGGGLLGRPVEMVVADGHSDEDTFAAQAERLIAREKVSALFACWTSACRKAVKPVVEKHRHLMFYPVQYEGLERSPNIVYLGAAPNQQIIPGTGWGLANLGKRVYLIGSDYFFPRAANRIIRDLVTVSNGAVLGERYLPLGERMFETVVEDIRRLKPDVVLNTINGDSNLHFFRALKAAGLGKTPVLSFSITEAEIQAMGPEVFHPNHYVVWGYFQSQPGEANQAFVAAFRARFGQERVTSDPIEAAYNGVRLWANAVRETGTEAPEYVNRNIGRQSVPGPSGVVAMDMATRHQWKRVRIGRVKADGQFLELQASPLAVRPMPFPSYRSMAEWQDIAAQLEIPQGTQP